MAQAARLSSRMHKELKLLLSDPPPGATFPYLSSDSLTAIDAQIEGPKGTAYENGYFHIRLQIPERYPFQPPVVTFATPIYHPNIDTGGRICLDILNLPPKGAWQPSLNISTVITSIGLLLSEPNPDDGLMCEASKEYKYNRQAFDQKARSMTEKYAKALGGGGGSTSSGNESFLINSNSNQGDEKDFKNDVRSEVNSLKVHRLSRKLSMQSSGCSKNSKDKRVADQLNVSPPNSQMEMKLGLESKCSPSCSNGNDGKQSVSDIRWKLSLEGSFLSRKRSSDETDKMLLTAGGGGLSCQDVGLGLGAKPPVFQNFPADCSNTTENVKSNEVQQVTEPASTGSCHNLPKISSLKRFVVDYGEVKPPVEEKYLVESNLTMPWPSYKHQLSRNKLNLGYQESEKSTKEDNKENIPQVALQQPTPECSYQPCKLHLVSSSVVGAYVSGGTENSKPSSSNQDIGVCRRLSLRPLRSLQANNESSYEVNAPSKGTSPQVRRESEPPVSSEVIVMDSEDEEERNEATISNAMVAPRRLCLARKRKSKQ